MDRMCARATCAAAAQHTLTYDYAASLAVLGPLSLVPDPHAYDLCLLHAERTSAPHGWQLVRHQLLGASGPTPIR